MAQYEASKEEIQQLVDSGSLSEATQNAIVSLLADSATFTVTEADSNVSGTDSTSQNLIASPGTTFGDGSGSPATFTNVENAVFQPGANGDLELTTIKPVTSLLDNPAGLNLDIKNDADNDLTLHEGQASVTTGDGNDNMSVVGPFQGQIQTGAGNLELTLDNSAQQQAEISVDAGDGFDLMKLLGGSVKHDFQFTGGRFHMHSGDVWMTGINLIATDVNEDGKITWDQDKITILASSEQESFVAKLYKIGLGRQAIDDDNGWSEDGSGDTLGGLHWWTTEYNFTSIDQLVRDFLNCTEFHNKYDDMDNAAFVDALVENLGATDAELQETLLEHLDDGSLDRYEAVRAVIEYADSVDIWGTDGENYVIDGF